MTGAPARGRALARVGLAGNPSDLYGGAVVAMAIDAFATTVTVDPAGPWDLAADGRRLLEATIARFAAHTGLAPTPGRVSIETSVPRQSGLAGSSAIVIGLLRALAAERSTHLTAFELAAMALAVEADDLGIVAGAQDRVAQAYEQAVLVDVADGLRADRIRVLDRSAVPDLVVAWAREAGEPSGDIHAPIRDRWLAGDPLVHRAATRWRDLAIAAAEALASRDRAALAAAMDASFDLRADLFPIGEADRRMIDLARAGGAAANPCGSGGSIVALAATDGETESLRARLRDAGFATCLV